MLSRRILRIKAVQAVYSHLISERQLSESEKEMWHSINKTHELFFYFLDLVVVLVSLEQDRIESCKNKKIPTYEDLNPNTKFINNKLIEKIRHNDQYLHNKKKKKIQWIEDKENLRSLMGAIKQKPYFIKYMQRNGHTFEEDKKLIAQIFYKDIVDFDQVYQSLEDKNIFWNSEIEYVINLIVRIINDFSENDDSNKRLTNLEENEDDLNFVKVLFRKTIINQEKYDPLIEKYTVNWDIKRIAFIDRLLLHMGINEIIEFSTIPVKVSLDEYIDISKLFSTRNSSTFINGVLDKIVNQLKSEKKIVKKGRGLINNKI
jgi:N utilization substance protein B